MEKERSPTSTGRKTASTLPVLDGPRCKTTYRESVQEVGGSFERKTITPFVCLIVHRLVTLSRTVERLRHSQP